MPQSLRPHTYTLPLSQMAPEVLPPACRATTSAGSPFTSTNLFDGAWLPVPSWPHTLAPASDKHAIETLALTAQQCTNEASQTHKLTQHLHALTPTCCKGPDPSLVCNQCQRVLQARCNLYSPGEVAGCPFQAQGGLGWAPPVDEVTSGQLQSKQRSSVCYFCRPFRFCYRVLILPS